MRTYLTLYPDPSMTCPGLAHRIAQARGAAQRVDERVVRTALQHAARRARLGVHAPRSRRVARVDACQHQRRAGLLQKTP